jgi:hypothetical protein
MAPCGRAQEDAGRAVISLALPAPQRYVRSLVP